MGRGAGDHFGTILYAFYIFFTKTWKFIPQIIFFNFSLPRGSFFYLAGDGEGGAGDRFGTILGQLYMIFIICLILLLKMLKHCVSYVP